MFSGPTVSNPAAIYKMSFLMQRISHAYYHCSLWLVKLEKCLPFASFRYYVGSRPYYCRHRTNRGPYWTPLSLDLLASTSFATLYRHLDNTCLPQEAEC